MTWVGEAGYWLVEDPDLSRSILTDNRFSSKTLGPSFDRFVSARVKKECSFLLDILGRWFVDQDPPDHTVERRLCQSHFSRALLDRLAPDIRNIVTEVLDGLPSNPDAITDIAQPISARVIALALGLNNVDSVTLHRWSEDIARFVGAVYRPDYAVAAQRSVTEMAGFVANQISPRGGNRARGVYRGDDENQSIAAHTMMLFGGLETSARLLTQLVWAATVGHHKSSTDLDGLIDSVLRRFPPIKFVTRISMCDVELCGNIVRKGELVLVSLASSADGSSPALAFGIGRHFCLGMTLTMLEARIFLEEFLARYPGATLDSEGIVLSDNALYSGFDRLPLQL
ncbi:hypothetical protein [Streptomyces parvulus]|uniref:hypothetical protein n=1 Tax=Streptomyces parvulus TaxID=146923 RepID=UPI00380504E4